MMFLLLLLFQNPDIQKLIRQTAESGRVLEIAVPDSQRAAPRPLLAPGAPPLVIFRLFEGRSRGRYTGLDLIIDDAGH